MKKILIIVSLIIVLIVSYTCYCHTNFYKLHHFNEFKYDNLMIVAHPDDELIWGGKEIIEDDYVVVCLTCGKNRVRNKEFKHVLSVTKDEYVFLNFKDERFMDIDHENRKIDNLDKELKRIINCKDWKKIVTHNPEGEYGHPQHKLVNRIVTKYATNNLFYFGHYYSRLDMKNYLDKELLPPSVIEEKNMLLDFYKSQKKVVEKFSHIMNYEKLIPSEEFMSYKKYV